ncbi:PhzF family phenazine biosynthesis protein [Hahella aquimaris]|uniref:PhzF family phenazine biosynthesis protein n=1 Tax=Hahella sp. HNIBRBA332 TaxID=3015983 RepID=UPI00273B11F1|nr:PhzF family phenazine biosynthesis protein [Hahella sp. HNIBRBA332]WLQ14168.1 PhzF family phenazine biosynthesis protein [Hahella sp. HNIBRBA332]
MSKHQYFQVDAFTSNIFSGNPAGVCSLDDWLPDHTLCKIAAENNLSETAFYVPRTNGFDLRWFTPEAEVDLCGHATLATAFVLYELKGFKGPRIQFHTRSGTLEVTPHKQGGYAMLFPSRKGEPVEPEPALLEALGGVKPLEVLKSRDYMVVLENEAAVRAVYPDMRMLKLIDSLGVIVTAKGDKVDFVSRFFAPKVGVPEDPVTGSAHCTLTPYWSEKLGKVELTARQISQRGGEVMCHYRGPNVLLVGQARLYLEGVINVPGES